MERANRIEQAIRHIPASSLAREQFDLDDGVESEQLLRDTQTEHGFGKAEWYHFAGDRGIDLDVADQIWFWYHPDEYDGDLYDEKREEVNEE